MMALGTYVRYWDGRTVGYGRVQGETETTYTVRVGGTDTEIELGKGLVTYHPAFIASGLVKSRKPLTMDQDRYLYHATATTNIPLIKQQGLKPRTMVPLESLGPEIWKGAEVETGRTQVQDPLGNHYRGTQKFFESGDMPGWMLDKLQFGDVGDFVYGTASKDTAAGYVIEVMKKGRQAVVLRFRVGQIKWYTDPKENAVMALTVVPPNAIEKHTVTTEAKLEQLNDVLEKEDIQDKILSELNSWEAL